MLNLHRDAIIFYQQNLRKNPRAEGYLRGRGITSEAQKLFSIGYAPDTWDALSSYLQNKDYKVETIKKAGLITHGTKNYYDTFRDRIIFPIFDIKSEIIAFGGRVMDDSVPKYLNSPDTPIFSKGRVLYGLNLAKDSIKKAGFAIFVEGYLDVITAHMHGFSNAVAPLGTALTQEHGKLIKRFTQEVVLVFDGDAAGIKAAKSGINILLESGLDIKVLPLPEGEDPDSFLKNKGKEAFSNLLKNAVSIIDFFVMQIGTDSYRKGAEHLAAYEALETIAKIPNSVLQGYYVRLLSEKLKINELFIREELRKTKKRFQSRDVSIKQRKYVKTPEIQPQVRPMNEIYLLQLILQFPARAKEIFDNISAEDFEGPVTKAIFEKMKGGLINYNALLSKCDEEERNLLTELSFKVEFEDPEKIFKDCLNRLKSKKRQILLDELQDKIKKAEQERNENLLKALLLEKHKLLRLKG